MGKIIRTYRTTPVDGMVRLHYVFINEEIAGGFAPVLLEFSRGLPSGLSSFAGNEIFVEFYNDGSLDVDVINQKIQAFIEKG